MRLLSQKASELADRFSDQSCDSWAQTIGAWARADLLFYRCHAPPEPERI